MLEGDQLNLDQAEILCSKLEGTKMKTEHPNNALYKFEGYLKLKASPRAIGVDNNQILLRGSSLKNTNMVLALVVFTGTDTKIMKN